MPSLLHSQVFCLATGYQNLPVLVTAHIDFCPVITFIVPPVVQLESVDAVLSVELRSRLWSLPPQATRPIASETVRAIVQMVRTRGVVFGCKERVEDTQRDYGILRAVVGHETVFVSPLLLVSLQ